MDGKQLRNSILQWAIQGKLVPQDPNDEPASVILDRIREEKARLVKEKKIKRDKNESIIYRGDDNSYYEKFTDGKVVCIDHEIPFEIPKGWEWCRLNGICYLIEDCPHSTAPDEGYGYPLVRTPNVGFAKLELKGTHRVCEETYKKRNARATPQHNDLIFAREAPAGNIAVIEEERVCLGQRTVLVRPFSKYINPYYLAYYILSPLSQKALVANSTGTTVAHVNLADFRPYIIAIPPYSEQTRIVDKLRHLLPFIDKYGKLQIRLDKLNESIDNSLKKSILQEAIQGRLVAQCETDEPAAALLEKIRAEKQRLVKDGKLKKSALEDSVILRGDDNKYWEKRGKEVVCIDDEIPFDIPENWEWTRIENVVIINPKNEADDNIEAAFIPMEKIDATYLSNFSYILKKWGEIKKGFTHFANGDVAFAKITPCFQNRKSMILEKLPNGIGAGTTELKVLRVIGNTILQEYLLFFLESPYFVDEAIFKGTANQQRIISGYLEKKLFPLPPLAEQQRIIEAIKSLWQVL